MRMYASIRFDREPIVGHHYISPGGFKMTACGKEYEFDFTGFSAGVDKEDPTVLKCVMSDLDVCGFPDAEKFKNVCNQIEKVNEFFVFTGEYDDPVIKPVELLAVSFWTYEHGMINLPTELLQNCLAY